MLCCPRETRIALRSIRATPAAPHPGCACCNNTKRAMEKAEGKEVPLIPEATIVPSGVVRLVELQEQGWAYVRP
jgi:hypothetical protein